MLITAENIASYVSAALNCKRGATAIEYGLIAAGIAVVIAAIIGTIGTDLNTKFTALDGHLK